MLQALRIISRMIFFVFPPSKALLGNDGKVIPAGPSKEMWNVGGVATAVILPALRVCGSYSVES